MNDLYTIKASVEFRHSVKKLRWFLHRKYGKELSSEQITAIKSAITNTLPNTPYIAPISQRLLELGIKDYRQWPIDSHNILFYKINEQANQVELLAVMDARQSIQKLLYEIMLLG